MPSEKQPFYDPVPPTYDEALAGSSRRREDAWSQRDERDAPNTESESLLRQAGGASASSSSRRPHGYRPPTVETDDEDSLFDGLSDDDDEDEVRQVMEEMDMEEPESRTSRWRKRMPFGLSLPRFKWPSFPRVRIQLPSGPGGESSSSNNDNNNNSESTTTPTTTWTLPALPKIDGVTVLVTVARLLALFILMGFFFFLFTSGLLVSPSQSRGGGRYPPASVEHHILNNIKPETLRHNMEHFSKYAHMAGTKGSRALADDMFKMFKRARLPYYEEDKYEVYLNYPKENGRAVELMDASGEHVEFSAVLEEDERHVETSGHQTYVFHGLSRSGDVKGPLIYANYGSRRDFEKLKEAGIDTKGAIALVRYYGPVDTAGLKVQAAEAAGFAGCLIYSDPADDGFKKSKEAPDGSGMPKGAVHRDTVALSHLVMGDILTPGWESKPELPRLEMQNVHMVNIPSLPLSWRDAEILLKRLKGHGEIVPENWKGAVPDVDWWTGNVTSPIVRLKNEQDEVRHQEIYNVYGKILGQEQGGKSIIIGNRRDAWSFGATDPHSGTAIMLELARIFGELYEFGWRPLRTIEFMSWDGGAYNNIGSTEYVEMNLQRLRNDAFAYIDLNAAVSGREFRASGSPMFKKILLSALDRVQDPFTTKSMRQVWEERHGVIENLGTDSDYVAFQNMAGTSSLHLEFSGNVFPRHSSFDTHDVVEMHTDPGFDYHVTMAKIVSFVLYELADLNILQLDLHAYGESLGHWTDDLQQWINDQPGHKEDKQKFSLDEMRQAVDTVKSTVANFAEWEQSWRAATRNSRGWEDEQVTELRKAYNDRMGQFETALLDQSQVGGGLPGRSQFRHMVFGPQLWPDRKDAYFPLIRDAIVDGNYTAAQEGVQKVAEHIRRAARALESPAHQSL